MKKIIYIITILATISCAKEDDKCYMCEIHTYKYGKKVNVEEKVLCGKSHSEVEANNTLEYNMYYEDARCYNNEYGK